MLVLPVALLLALAICGGSSQTPDYPFNNPKLPWDQRVADLVSRLTLEEKLAQLSRGGAGSNSPVPPIPRLGINSFQWGSECATGLGTDDSAPVGTSFPQPLGLAASFNPVLANSVGDAIGRELRAQNNYDLAHNIYDYHHGIDTWCPVVNIMRAPLWGRNDETFGECPVLTSLVAGGFVSGLRGTDPRFFQVSTACKHLDAYGGPDDTRATFNAQVSQRDLVTTFLPAFKACVEAGATGFMCSFNSVRGVPACANYRTMTFYPRQVWNASTFVVSDQGALTYIQTEHNYTTTLAAAAAAAINAGCDLEDANDNITGAFLHLQEALDQNLTTLAAVNTSLQRLFYVRMRLGEFDPPPSNPYRQLPASIIRSPEHLALAEEAAMNSFVLLKNAGNALPYSRAALQQLAVLGPFANSSTLMYGKYSPHGALPDTVTPLTALTAAAEAAGGQVSYAAGCASNLCPSVDHSGITAALKDATAVALCLGTGYTVESEQKDRVSLALPGQQAELLALVAQAKPAGAALVVILFTAGPVDLAAVVNDSRVDAILDAFYPGERAGPALARVLTGQRSPVGRLPMSWPTALSDVPAMTNYSMAGRTYRYNQPHVLFPFGYGLSFVQFEYSSLQLSATSVPACGRVNLNVTVSNVGAVAANETVQVYLEWAAVTPSTPTPARQLVLVQTLPLAAKGAQSVSLTLKPEHWAVVSDPQCYAQYADTDFPNATILQRVANLGSAADCCARCQASGDPCESWTFVTATGECLLKAGRSASQLQSGYVSGDVTPVWVVRPARLRVYVGGQQPHQTVSAPSNVLAASLTVEGPEVPINRCS